MLDSLADDLFDDAKDSGAASIDGMFATLEPVDGLAEEPRPVRQSSPKVADRISATPMQRNGSDSTAHSSARARDSVPQRGLADAEAADVDNLFAGLEGRDDSDDDATTDEMARPSAPSAGVFSPGSTRPSFAPIADDLTADGAFGEADLLGGEDKGAPPFDGEDDDGHDGARAYDDVPGAIGAASEPPMLRLAEPQAAPKPEPSKRSPGMLIAIAAVALLVLGGGALALFKPDLLAKWGILASDEPPPAPPAAPEVPVEVPAQPMIEPAAAAANAPAPAAPAAQPPAAELIEVNVTSLPRGADVRVDGVLKSQTPTNVDLPLGRESNVTVSAPGYAAQAKLVTAKRGMDPLRYKLDPLPYVLVVNTTPPGAQLTVGSVTSVAPAPLALGHVTGSVDVAVTKDGYRRTTRPVRLDEFTEKDGVLRAEIEVSLSPMPGAEAPPAEAAPSEPQATPEPSSPSRRRRSRDRDRSPESAPAPPEPEAEAAADPKPEAAAEPEAAPEPAKEPGAPPPPPALPSLP